MARRTLLRLPLLGLLGALSAGPLGCGSPGAGDMMPMNPMNPMTPMDPNGPLDPPVECPSDLDCEFIPAAYEHLPMKPDDYGSYDLANRPMDGLDIRYIVIHDTEGSFQSAVDAFRDPTHKATAHYIVRSSDGHIAQMVKLRNVAWHAGNWYVNAHSIGIEHEGVAIDGAKWYTETMYRASARLVRYLARKYNVPLDRAHIIGHEDVPGPTQKTQPGMHWDPGPFWDWGHYMDLVLAGAPEGGTPSDSIAEIAPDFAGNQQHLTYCYGSGMTPDCHDVPAQGSTFVYLHQMPDDNAPYVQNMYLGGDPTRAPNWGDKASTGLRFYLAERMGDWDAIYFSGQKAWFHDPMVAGKRQNARTGPGMLLAPKPGMASVPVYGRAYPESGAYPMGMTPQNVEKIYDLPAGEIYVGTAEVGSDYYSVDYGKTLQDGKPVIVKGQDRYYQVFFNHRLGFVKTSDVDRLLPK